MALLINTDCTHCGVCASECPTGAIRSAVGIWLIDPNRCTECVGDYATPQCAKVCLSESIVRDLRQRESKEQLMEKFLRNWKSAA